jgi:hypothetical protein
MPKSHAAQYGFAYYALSPSIFTLARTARLRVWLQITYRPKTCHVLKTWQVYHPYQEVNIGQILTGDYRK